MERVYSYNPGARMGHWHTWRRLRSISVVYE